MTTAAQILARPNAKIAHVLEIEGVTFGLAETRDPTFASSWASTWATLKGTLEPPPPITRQIRPLTFRLDKGTPIEFRATDRDGALVDLFADDHADTIVTYLTADLGRTDTTVTVESTAAFPASGTIHIGVERITYSGKTATTFTGCTRGTYPFGHATAWARTHKAGTGQSGKGAEVSDRPIYWRGRGATLYVTAWDPDTGLWIPKASAVKKWAGWVERVKFEGGFWRIACRPIEDSFGTKLLRDPFRASAKASFNIAHAETYTVEEIVMTSTPTVTSRKDEITIPAGTYSLALPTPAGTTDLIATINTELAAMGTAIYDWSFVRTSGPDGWQIYLLVATGSVSSAALLAFQLTPKVASRCEALVALGYTTTGAGVSSTPTTDNTYRAPAPFEPAGAWVAPGGGSIEIDNVQGTWATQPSDEFPASAQTPTQAEGYILVGEDTLLPFAVIYNDPTFDIVQRYHVATLLSGVGGAAYPGDPVAIPLGSDATIQVRQVWIARGRVSRLLLRLLLSTGTAGYNDATYDVWPDCMGLGIPAAFVDIASIEAIDELVPGLGEQTLTVLNPEEALPYIEGFMAACGFYLVWRRGKIAAVTPTTAIGRTADYDLDESNKGNDGSTSMDDGSSMILGRLIFRCNRDPSSGEYLYSETYDNVVGNAATEGKAATIEVFARHMWVTGPTDPRLQVMRETVAAPLCAYYTRGLRLFKRTGAPGLAGLSAGDIVSFSDDEAPNARTGTYGHEDSKGWLISRTWDPDAQEFSDLQILIPPGRSYPLSPSAMLDYSRGDFGYDPGGPAIYVRQHEFSYTSETLDYLSFGSGGFIRIIEADPANPASPTTWVRGIDIDGGTPDAFFLDSPLSAPAWDPTKRYYVEPDDWGTVAASQQDTVFLADATDGYLGTADPPFTWGQGLPATLESGTPDETFRYRRFPTVVDDVDEPFSVHTLRDLVACLNNLYAHVTNQSPVEQQYAVDRTSDNVNYSYLAGPWAVYCPPGVQTLVLDITCKMGSALYNGGLRATASTTLPRGDTLTALEHASRSTQVESATTTSTSYVVLTIELPVQPGPDGVCYVTLEGRISVDKATAIGVRGVSGYFAARSVA